MAAGFLYARSSPQKSRTPYNKTDAAFLLLSSETVSRFPPCKDFLTLDLKYYEKKSLQI